MDKKILIEHFEERGICFSHYDKRSVEYFIEWLLENYDLRKIKKLLIRKKVVYQDIK